MKSFLQSRTIGLNTFALVVALVQHYFGVLPLVNTSMYTIAVAVINIGLRFRTSKAIGFSAA